MQIELAFLEAGMGSQQGRRAKASGWSLQGGGGKIHIAEAGDFEEGVDRLGGIRDGSLIVLVSDGCLCGGSLGARGGALELRDAGFQAIDAGEQLVDQLPGGRVGGLPKSAVR